MEEKRYLSKEEAIESLKGHAKNWLKKNWIKLAFAGGIGTGLYILVHTQKELKKIDDECNKEAQIIIDALTKPDKFSDACRIVDEDIFTRVAPEIEDAILCEGLDEYVMDKTYTIDYPRKGDSSNGFYSTNKNLHITITDITE